jgi:hypothetical protein
MNRIQLSVKERTIPIATTPQHLRTISAEAPDFRELWLRLYDQLPIVGNRYHPAIFEYYKMLSADGVEDCSFIILSEETPVALVPLLIERIGNQKQASYCKGGYLPHPIFNPHLGSKQIRSLEAKVFEAVTTQLNAKDATCWFVEADVLSFGTDAIEDQLAARFGALDVSTQCHIVDLTKPDEDLWQQIRHSSKSIINKGLRTYGFKVYDRSNFTFEVGERHRLLHHKAAGRITRPIPTFHKMYSWVHEDHGLMFEQTYDNRTVQMIFVVLGKGTACGASAADDPDFVPPVPLTHSMNFFIYKETQKRGVKYYDVGDTSYRDTMFNMRTVKERTISDFKRGFGQQTCPQKRWIWFASRSDEIKFLEQRLAAYKSYVVESAPDSEDGADGCAKNRHFGVSDLLIGAASSPK